MDNLKESFLPVTQRIFSNWTALKMAVEHGMGSKEDVIEFCSFVTQVMFMNDNLNDNEIAQELEEYMDVQFNTELGDNSCIEVAKELLRFQGYCLRGATNEMQMEVEKLPPLQKWIETRNSNLVRVNENQSSSEEESMDVETSDEWTEVRTRRKR